ncbi:putative Serpin family protein [Helianthus annuus]|uniref:Putative serpin n=1 Tax=Helianthus annuus TaxID=4232 RepID=A0A251URV1_HELAN|nr:putative Serpin family protein [Helianthus annuus]KAJ0570769.1 putative Serpin family protein [Helianthus annuus]KAJ0577713.1 putative Serpin family protein [Helianthus annuus]KAJ0585110.1 putative Serpin family protein [Helianthus annuus]KAJ0919579.1 putative Serpin family protein [Helianthus annuus]
MLAFTSSSMDLKHLKQPVSNQTHVSTTIATHLLSKKRDTNVVFFPLSIHVALSVLAASSKGQTLDQILAFLKTNTTINLNSFYLQLVSLIFFPNARPKRGPRLPFSSGGPRLSFANRFWVDKTLSLKPSFKNASKSVIATRSILISIFILFKTKGLIKEIITVDEVSNVTWLIFANADYFKGLWMDKFSPFMTNEYDFHLLDGNKVQVPFMTHHALKSMGVYDDFKVLCLPYLRGDNEQRYSMYFFLPNAKDGLQSLVQKSVPCLILLTITFRINL